MKEDPNRRNVFRLSGNMALGSNSNQQLQQQGSQGKQIPTYSQQEANRAKNSLKLLKQKQQMQQIPRMYNNQSNQRQNMYSNQQKDNKNVNAKYQGNTYEQQNTISSNTNNKNTLKSQWSTNNKTTIESINNKPPMVPRNRNGNNNTQTSLIGSQTKEKPINQLKKQAKLEIVEYDESDLILCSQGCGRKFNPQSISKHENVCKKVFQQKRKQFNTQAQRIVEKDQIKLMKKGAIIDKKIQQQKKKNEKMPKWKAESTAFRSMLQQNQGGKMNAEQQKQYKKAQQALKQASGYVKCPTCGRSFNQKAGQRHIPFCQEQSKKNQFKNVVVKKK